MVNLHLNTATVDETIVALNQVARNHAAKDPVTLSYKGNFKFTGMAEELRELLEQTRLLWYNISGFEAAVLKDVKEQMLLQDKQAGAQIGGGR